MAPKSQQKTNGASADAHQDEGKRPPFTEEERRKESSKTAQKALQLQKKANELTQAAAGAADPEERQKLLKLAIDASIEAESFGKVAKYMRTGTFQGMAAGVGLGLVPGVTLGTLTGTLVGGLTSIITGGLGGVLGMAVGAIHGPFIDIAGEAADGIRSITGDLPGWKASPEQKAQLEKMIGLVNEQDRPTEQALQDMSEWGSGEANQANQLEQHHPTTQAVARQGAVSKKSGARKSPRKLETRSARSTQDTDSQGRKPKKLQVRS